MVKAVGLENSRVLQGVKGPGRQPRLTGCGKGEGFVRGGGELSKGAFPALPLRVGFKPGHVEGGRQRDE
jgi:hypothetical protein